MDIYDGIKGYFLDHVYPSHIAFDHGVIAMTALCGLVVAIVFVSFMLRLKSAGISWILPDSAMSRLDFRNCAPLLFAVFASCKNGRQVPLET